VFRANKNGEIHIIAGDVRQRESLILDLDFLMKRGYFFFESESIGKGLEDGEDVVDVSSI